MKSEDALSKLAHFFNDFVGAVVPGLILLVLFGVLHPGLWKYAKSGMDADSTLALLVVIGICFGLGHGLLGLYYAVIERVVEKIGLVRSKKAILAEAELSRSFALTKQIVVETFGTRLSGAGQNTAPITTSEIRNLAMTLSPESAMLGRRFMFIALLGQGTGTAFALLAIETTAVAIVCAALRLQSFLIQYSAWWGYAIQAIILLLVAGIFYWRGDQFHALALKTPFSVAPVEILLSGKEINENKE